MSGVWDIISGLVGAYDAYQGSDDQTVRPNWLPGQRDGFTDAIAAARGAFNAGGMQYYPNSTVADVNPWREAGWMDQLASTDRQQQLADMSANAAIKLASGGDKVGGFTLQDQIGFGIPEEYENAIMNPIMRNLENRIIPNLHSQAVQQGAFGGSRMQQQKADAAEQATKAATDAMIMGNLQARQQSIGQRAGDISAQLQGRNQDITQNQYGLENAYRGVNALGTAINQQLAPGTTMTNIGNQAQQYDQMRLSDDVNRFNFNQQEAQNNIDRLIARMNLGGQQIGTTIPGQSGNWLDALGGFFAGSNMYNTAMGVPSSVGGAKDPSQTGG